MNDNPAQTLAIYAALTYDIIAATNSSPQTTEINAAKRADSLMKWVRIGTAQTIIFVAIGVTIEAKRGNPIWPPIVGTLLAAGLLYIQYVYALQCGLRSAAPPTENYN
jgi:hypothetical protein